MNKNIIIIILSILLVSLSGYIVYDKVLTKEDEKTTINNDNKVDNIQEGNSNLNEENDTNQDDINNNISNEFESNNSNDNQNTEQTDNIDIEVYEEIIETKLLKLLSSKSLKETSNQDILAMIFEMYKNEYGWKEEIPKIDLMAIKEKSILKNISVEYTNLGDYTMAYNYGDNGLYQLDSSHQKYIYQNTGHAENNISIIYKELINSSTKDNEITLSYKYVFAKTNSKSAKTTPGYHSLYYNFDDKKAFKEFSFMDINEEIGRDISYHKAKTYIAEIYNEIKDNLYTYTFVFTNDNDIVLKDYYRE